MTVVHPARCPHCHQPPDVSRGTGDDDSHPWVAACWHPDCEGVELGMGASAEAAIEAWNRSVVASFLAACAACPCRDRSRVN
jgi:hypothetical protein